MYIKLLTQRCHVLIGLKRESYHLPPSTIMYSCQFFSLCKQNQKQYTVKDISQNWENYGNTAPWTRNINTCFNVTKHLWNQRFHNLVWIRKQEEVSVKGLWERPLSLSLSLHWRFEAKTITCMSSDQKSRMVIPIPILAGTEWKKMKKSIHLCGQPANPWRVMIQPPATLLGWTRKTRYFMDNELIVQTRPLMGLNHAPF